MADYPTKGSTPWDVTLKAYIDDYLATKLGIPADAISRALILSDGSGGSLIGRVTQDADGNLAAVNGFALDTSPTVPTYAAGKFYWDANANTLSVMTGFGNSVLQVGKEVYIEVRNSTGATITNGQVVRISGATGNKSNASLANASSITTSDVIGVATHDIANNSNGLVTVFGEVGDLNTSAYAEGTKLYLSTTSGAFTTTLPSTPNRRVFVATVLRQHATLGVIHVRVQTLQHINTGIAVPASATASGTTGDLAFDTDYVYLCVATNTWRRVALSSW